MNLDRQMKPWQAWLAWSLLVVITLVAIYFAP